MSRGTILIIDDDERFRETLGERLEFRGFSIHFAADGKEALEIARENHIDLALVDMEMSDMAGPDIVARLLQISPDLHPVLLSEQGSDRRTAEIKAGNIDFFEKGDMGRFWDYLGALGLDSLHTAKSALPKESKTDDPYARRDAHVDQTPRSILPEQGLDDPDPVKLIVQTEGMLKLKSEITEVAPHDCSVLILGELGTGKKLTARLIHDQDPRAVGRLLILNCGAFSEEFITRELFGSEQETEGDKAMQGAFQTLAGGTILLEEVGRTPPAVQKRLVHVLRDKTVKRRGNKEVPLNVRILATSEEDLSKMIKKGRFDKELYRCLSDCTLKVPPLRERRDDIDPLCGYFLMKSNRNYNKNIQGFDQEFMDALMSYPFPGNVGELESIVERAVIICREAIITGRCLPERFRTHTFTEADLHEDFPTLEELEKRYIRKVLKALDGNRNQAAKTLGISRAGLWRKLKKMEEDL